ncbi:hypothetical protein J6590_107281, partial [Homalodisca vitripennis]
LSVKLDYRLWCVPGSAGVLVLLSGDVATPAPRLAGYTTSAPVKAILPKTAKNRGAAASSYTHNVVMECFVFVTMGRPQHSGLGQASWARWSASYRAINPPLENINLYTAESCLEGVPRPPLTLPPSTDKTSQAISQRPRIVQDLFTACWPNILTSRASLVADAGDNGPPTADCDIDVALWSVCVTCSYCMLHLLLFSPCQGTVHFTHPNVAP